MYTARTDQLHIGNRWIGHKGLDIYDNTARLHDPVLMRFHTPDSKYTSYPSHSPWAHCAANPIAFIDKTGMDYFQMDDRGYISLIYETDDDFDIIGANGNHLNVEKGFLTPFVTAAIPGTDYKSVIYSTNSDDAEKYFKFLSENSNVEWSIFYSKNGTSYIGTTNLEDKDGSATYFLNDGKDILSTIYQFDHSHTKFEYPNASDASVAEKFPDKGSGMLFSVYFTPKKVYHSYTHDNITYGEIVVYGKREKKMYEKIYDQTRIDFNSDIFLGSNMFR